YSPPSPSPPSPGHCPPSRASYTPPPALLHAPSISASLAPRMIAAAFAGSTATRHAYPNPWLNMNTPSAHCATTQPAAHSRQKPPLPAPALCSPKRWDSCWESVEWVWWRGRQGVRWWVAWRVCQGVVVRVVRARGVRGIGGGGGGLLVVLMVLLVLVIFNGTSFFLVVISM
ncbi:hypothetical protein DFP73DRAFT_609516, partial [Morchella snyderi]